MKFIKRLMEIKEEQRMWEEKMSLRLNIIIDLLSLSLKLNSCVGVSGEHNLTRGIDVGRNPTRRTKKGEKK